jgi:hypothetical protein
VAQLEGDAYKEGAMRATTKQALTGGLYAGLLGYLVVVVFLALVNLLAGRSPSCSARLCSTGCAIRQRWWSHRAPS